MPRAIWSGSISFGLINVPVKLYSAVTEKSVRFNQIDTRNGARIRTRKVNAEDGSDVPPDVIAKGYEVSKGRYVVVGDDELASLQPRATHTIDLQEFVDLADIDPIYFHGAYWVAPDDRAGKSYSLLVEAMEQAGKVAIARFVMRAKQYVAVMRPSDGRLVLSMMVYEDEINPATDIVEFDRLDDVEVTERELAMAEQLIESLSAEFKPEEFRDSYRDDLLDLIHAKEAGEERVVASLEGPDDGTVVDLMAALEASVAAARDARGRHPSTGDAEVASGVVDEPAPKRSAGTRSATSTRQTKAATGRAGARKAGAGAGATPAGAKKRAAKKPATGKPAAGKSVEEKPAKKATARTAPARRSA